MGCGYLKTLRNPEAVVMLSERQKGHSEEGILGKKTLDINKARK